MAQSQEIGKPGGGLFRAQCAGKFHYHKIVASQLILKHASNYVVLTIGLIRAGSPRLTSRVWYPGCGMRIS